MSVVIHQPEIEALVKQHLATGAFEDVEALFLHLLHSVPAPVHNKAEDRANLVEVCAMVKGLTEDIDFSRDTSAGRLVELT